MRAFRALLHELRAVSHRVVERRLKRVSERRVRLRKMTRSRDTADMRAGARFNNGAGCDDDENERLRCLNT